jgi:hypothetical protein
MLPTHIALVLLLMMSLIKSFKIRMSGAGVSCANGLYHRQDPSAIPVAFAKVCKKQLWDTEATWKQLTDMETPWYLKEDDGYIYYNRGDGKWWLDDGEKGLGLYIVPVGGNIQVPPTTGWDVLSNEYQPIPSIEIEAEEEL